MTSRTVIIHAIAINAKHCLHALSSEYNIDSYVWYSHIVCLPEGYNEATDI